MLAVQRIDHACDWSCHDAVSVVGDALSAQLEGTARIFGHQEHSWMAHAYCSGSKKACLHHACESCTAAKVSATQQQRMKTPSTDSALELSTDCCCWLQTRVTAGQTHVRNLTTTQQNPASLSALIDTRKNADEVWAHRRKVQAGFGLDFGEQGLEANVQC